MQVARWFLFGGCDWLFVRTMLLCGLRSLCCSYGLALCDALWLVPNHRQVPTHLTVLLLLQIRTQPHLGCCLAAATAAASAIFMCDPGRGYKFIKMAAQELELAGEAHCNISVCVSVPSRFSLPKRNLCVVVPLVQLPPSFKFWVSNFPW
jgi:hypothetical protein